MDLSEEEAEASLDILLSEAEEALISAFLVLLAAKGETFEEVSAKFSCFHYVDFNFVPFPHILCVLVEDLHLCHHSLQL